jgi:hypothetical protein
VTVGVLVAGVGAVIAIAQAAGGGGGDPESGAPRPTVAAPPTDQPATTVSLPVRAAPPVPPNGVAFTDPHGTYTMTIGAAWTDVSSRLAGGTQAWAVTNESPDFAANVNVVSQAAPGLDLDAVMATSASSLVAIGGDVLDRSYVTAPEGARLGTMRYLATPAGAPGPLEFLAVFDVRDGTAVVGTLTATPDSFAAVSSDVEPYLLTLRAAG